MTEPLFKPYTQKLDYPWEELGHDRSRCPVAYSEHLNGVQISSYVGIREVMEKLPDAFTGTYSTLYRRDEPLPEEEQVFSAADPPRHTRQRRLFVKAMSASRIQHMRPFSERLADELIDAIVRKGNTFDLVTAYARKVSEGHIAELLGIPEEDRERFLHLSSLFELSTADPESRAHAADMAAWHTELAETVRSRRAAGPGSDDLITKLCFAEDDGDRLDELEVAAMIRSMIRAGNSTTSAAIGNTVAALERHPEQKAKYLADIDGLTSSLLDEGLRYDGPALGLWRRCVHATTIQGRELSPGDRIFTVYTAGNHDPEAFDRSEQFIIDRDWRQLPPHLAFGFGIHHCIGMNLARLECETSIAALYRRLPGLRLKPGRPTSQTPGPILRSWLRLELEFMPPALPAASR